MIESSACSQVIFFGEWFLICKLNKNYMVKVLTSSIVLICWGLHQSFNFRSWLQRDINSPHLCLRATYIKSVLPMKTSPLHEFSYQIDPIFSNMKSTTILSYLVQNNWYTRHFFLEMFFSCLIFEGQSILSYLASFAHFSISHNISQYLTYAICEIFAAFMFYMVAKLF